MKGRKASARRKPKIRLEGEDRSTRELEALTRDSLSVLLAETPATVAVVFWCGSLQRPRLQLFVTATTRLSEDALRCVADDLFKRIYSLCPAVLRNQLPSPLQILSDLAEATQGLAPNCPETEALPTQHVVPVVSACQPLGLIALYSGQREAFALEHLNLVHLMAARLAASHEGCAIHDATGPDAPGRLASEFFSLVVHELRTPLTVIKGHAQLLLRQAENRGEWKPASPSLRTIVEQTDRLDAMISRLLDFSRLQLGTLDLHRRSIDLVKLVEDVAAEMQRLTDKHRISPRLQVSRLEGWWDAGYLEQVLANLLENAIKYSPDGGEVEVTVCRCDDEVVVSVRDYGIGIGHEAQAHLFQRLYRSPQARTLGVRGLGLGLYISKQIVSAHGGRIWVESEPGQGSTFYFTLPLTPPTR